MAAAYVNGLQSEGVSASSYLVSGLPPHIIYHCMVPAIKHLVANDQEHERTAADSVVSNRALREIYLYPCAHGSPFCSDRYSYRCVRFMLAQKYAQPGAYMTS